MPEALLQVFSQRWLERTAGPAQDTVDAGGRSVAAAAATVLAEALNTKRRRARAVSRCTGDSTGNPVGFGFERMLSCADDETILPRRAHVFGPVSPGTVRTRSTACAVGCRHRYAVSCAWGRRLRRSRRSAVP